MFLLLEHVVVVFDWGDVFVRFLLSLLFVCVCVLLAWVLCVIWVFLLGAFIGCSYWVLLLEMYLGVSRLLGGLLYIFKSCGCTWVVLEGVCIGRCYLDTCIGCFFGGCASWVALFGCFYVCFHLVMVLGLF